MKTLSAVTLVAIVAFGSSDSFAAGASSANSAHRANQPLSLVLKSNAEVAKAFEADPALTTTNAAQELASVLHAGQRAYRWIKVVNAARAPGLKPLSYSDPSTTTSPSLAKPKIYNAEIAKNLYAEIAAEMPAAYRAIIEGNDPLPAVPPVNDVDFIHLGLKTTLAYDTGVRWIMMQDYLAYYEAQKISDVRGYYFLANLPQRETQLKDFKTLPTALQEQIHDWMVDLCLNNEDPANPDTAACEADVHQAEAAQTLIAYYTSKIDKAKELWDSFFVLFDDSVRTDLTWTAKDPNTLSYPFLQPTNAVTLAYLRDNVEDEWKLGAWKLKLDFTTVDQSPTLSRLEYKPNVTPHAETNKIVMDENEPLTEYLAQWTIRHEFGHLLGFKDCYVEYYDTGLKAMVNYPLDPTNLMCSRLGHLQPQHLEVLKAAYFAK